MELDTATQYAANRKGAAIASLVSLLSLCDCMAIDWSALTFTSGMVKRALLSPWRQSGPGTRCGGFRYPPQFVTAAVWQLNYYKCLRARVPGRVAAHREVEDRQQGRSGLEAARK